MLHVLRATACMGVEAPLQARSFGRTSVGRSDEEIVPRVSYVVDGDSLICMDDQSHNRFQFCVILSAQARALVGAVEPCLCLAAHFLCLQHPDSLWISSPLMHLLPGTALLTTTVTTWRE